MATRFRLPSAGAAAVSVTVQSYTHTGSTRLRMATTDASALGTGAVTPDAADHLVAGDTLLVQYVGDQMAVGNVFTAGDAFKAVLQGLESNAANNLVFQFWLGVVSSDGATARATLLAKSADATELATTLTSRAFSTTLSGGYTTVAGDRLVLEISVTGTPTASGGTQGHNASLRIGSNGAGGDLAENDTQTGTTLNPWMEVATTIVFAAAARTPLSTLLGVG